MTTRFEAVATFIVTLYTLSRASPRSWQRADAVARNAGLPAEQLEQVLADAVHTRLVDQCADDPMRVVLTNKGREVAAG